MTEAAARTTPSLRLLVLRTRQLDRLRAFYEAIGVSFVQEQHGTGPVHYAAELDGMVLELYPLAVDVPTNNSLMRLGFSVSDLYTTIPAAMEIGGVFQFGPSETPRGLRAVVQDPDGRTVELYQG